VHSECRTVLEAAMASGDAAAVEELLAGHRRRGVVGSLLDAELVVLDSPAATKDEAIEELVDALFCAGRTDRPIALEDAVWAREAVYSTGLGHGFAIPHCKSDAIASNSIAVARLRRPLPWGSVDEEPVRCAILLAVRESDDDGSHMKVFSKLARRLMHEEFRERMLAAPDRDSVLSCLAEELGLAGS
jgi:fructose-specific PTS system IIA-like component